MPFHKNRTAFMSALVCLCLLLAPAHANQNTADRHIQNAEIVGEARLKVMFWSVFDATLYATGGRYDPDKPFALSLSYLRELDGKQIVDKTMSEIERQSSIVPATRKRWRQALLDIIPDVDASTTITGVRDADGNTLFYENGSLIGRVDEPEFATAFFEIWLGRSSANPALTRQLLGMTNS